VRDAAGIENVQKEPQIDEVEAHGRGGGASRERGWVKLEVLGWFDPGRWLQHGIAKASAFQLELLP